LAPGGGAEGVDVFVLREVQSLHEGLAEVGESGGGFGFDVALGYGGEEPGEGFGYVAGGDVVASEEAGDVLAGLFTGEELGFFLGVKEAEIRMAGAARHAALAAVGESESTEWCAVFVSIAGLIRGLLSGSACGRIGRRTVGTIRRHGILHRKRFGILGFCENLAGREA